MLSNEYDELYAAKMKKGQDDNPDNYPQPPRPNTPKGSGYDGTGDNPGSSSSTDPSYRTNRGGFKKIHPNGK